MTPQDRRTVLLEAAKLVCPICAKGAAKPKKMEHYGGTWMHLFMGWSPRSCAAGQIFQVLEDEKQVVQ